MNDVAGDASDETRRRTLLTERVAAAPSLAEGLSHEVHNPLNCALLQLAVLQRRLEQPDCRPETLQPVAELVEQALRRLELLLNDFLSFVRPRADGTAPLSAGDRSPGVANAPKSPQLDPPP